MDNNKLVSDLSGILNGLDSSQEQLEKDAFDVINSSDTSLNLVKESISSVEEILKTISELNEIAEESAARIKELEKLSKDIEQFAGVISSISSRTNILSLNASIEAARAGEHGRGFAVVADEIRSLSEQSSAAANNIRDILQGLEATTGMVSAKVNAGAGAASDGVAKMDDMLKVFEAVRVAAENASAVVDEEYDVIASVKTGFDNIHSEIETLMATTEENSAMISNIVESIARQNDSVDSMKGEIVNISELSEKLRGHFVEA